MRQIQDIEFNIEVWKEGDSFVSYAPQIDISSCGDTLDEARKNIHEALALYFEESDHMGTLSQVLEEAGFARDNTKQWRAPEMVAYERFTLAFS